MPSDFHIYRLFHSPILRSLSFMAVYIPSFQVLRGRPRFFVPSRFQCIFTHIIFTYTNYTILQTTVVFFHQFWMAYENSRSFRILKAKYKRLSVCLSVCPTFRTSFNAFCIMMHWSNERTLTRVLQEYTCLSLGVCAWITGQLGGSLCKYKSFWLPRFASWRSSRKTRSLWCGYVHGGCCSSLWFLREVQIAMAETFDRF